MNTKKNNRLEKTKIIFIDIISLIIIGGSIALDCIYTEIIQGEIISVSLDSIICVVSILASVLLPRSENQHLKNYNIDPKDYRALKKTTNRTFFNLFFLSIVLFIGDMLFYAFELRLTLIVSFVVILADVILFLWDTIVDAIQGDNAIIKTAKKQLQKYYKDNETLNSLITENNIVSDGSLVINKIVNAIVLKIGIENSIRELGYHKDDCIIEKQDLFIYIINLQDFFAEQINLGKNSDIFAEDESLNKIISQYIDNLRVICCNAGEYFKLDKTSNKSEQTSLPRIDESIENSNEINNDLFFVHVKSIAISLFDNLNSIINEDKAFGLVKNNFYDLINTLFTSLKTKESTHDIFEISILTELLDSTLSKNDVWVVNAIGSCVTNNKYTNDYKNTFYLLYVIFKYVDARYKKTRGKNNVSPIVLNEKALEAYRQTLKTYTNPRLNMPYDDIIDYFDWFSDFLDKGKNKRRKTAARMRINEACYGFATCLLIDYCYNDKYLADDILRSTRAASQTHIIYGIKQISLERTLSRIPFYSNQIHLFLSETDEVVFNEEKSREVMDYISSYRQRARDISDIQNSICFNQFINDVNSSFKHTIGYEEQIANTPTKKEQYSHDQFTIAFMVPKNEVMNITNDNTFSNPKHILNVTMNPIYRFYANICETINEYTPAIYRKILKFKPIYKYAPLFDQYCGHIEDPDVSYFLNMQNEYFYLETDESYEVFMKKNPLEFNALLKEDESYIRLMRSSDLLESNSHHYQKSYNKAVNHEKSIHGEDSPVNEINEYIIQDYVMVICALSLEVVFNPKRLLVYHIDTIKPIPRNTHNYIND